MSFSWASPKLNHVPTALWSNGNTTVFETGVSGSNPGRALTIIMEKRVNDIIDMEKFKQGVIFGDIKYNGMRPSDIDLVMEIRDKAWIIAEIKTEGKDLDIGQRLMLERLCKDLRQTGKPVLCVVATHNYPVDEDINAGECIVWKSYNGREWQEAKKEFTLKYLIDWFMDKYL